MQKNEFEVLYGRHVSADEYSSIERVYMAAPTIDKERFCKEWRALRLGQSQLVAELAERVERLLVSRDQYKHSAEQREEALTQAKRALENAVAGRRGLNQKCDALEVEKQQWQHTAEQEKKAKELLQLDYNDSEKANVSLMKERDAARAENDRLALVLIRSAAEQDAIEIIGRDAVIALKCTNDILLTADDKAYIADRLKRQ